MLFSERFFVQKLTSTSPDKDVSIFTDSLKRSYSKETSINVDAIATSMACCDLDI